MTGTHDPQEDTAEVGAHQWRTIRILIASPSDVDVQREDAVRVIQEWNDLYSYSRKVALLPLRWETHAAPEYGTRPQEVINRVVDDCDLLVGIFWTRLGSPTGVSDSGTLEEIERVGKAGKPIMLYFSNVEIDPDRIDIEQIKKLKVFKTRTYPDALVESYRKAMQFRDKFSKQLELQLRLLEASDAIWKVPLSLQFLSQEKEEPIGDKLAHDFDHPQIHDFNAVPPEDLDEVRQLATAAIKEKYLFPIPLAIENSSPSGIRNLYVELDLTATSNLVEVVDRPSIRRGGRGPADFFQDPVEKKLAKFGANPLQKTDEGWRWSFEWDALQPKRIRLITPVLYIYTPTSAELSVNAKVFAHSFPKPFVLQAKVSIEARDYFAELDTVLPNWKKLLEGDRGPDLR
jgi:hypothetical protein